MLPALVPTPSVYRMTIERQVTVDYGNATRSNETLRVASIHTLGLGACGCKSELLLELTVGERLRPGLRVLGFGAVLPS